MEAPSRYGELEQTYLELLELEPKLITATVPANASEQKTLFLAGDIAIPDHIYPKLQVAEKALEPIRTVSDRLMHLPGLDQKHVPVYAEFVTNYLKKTQLMAAMDRVKTAPADQGKEAARQEFMQLNTELYGEPDRVTYVSLLQEKLSNLAAKDLSGDASRIYEELLDRIPPIVNETHEPLTRFRPAEETVSWIHDAALALYEPLLSHVPDQEQFTVEEVQDIFMTILTKEFGEAADGWRVNVETAKSINVKSVEKRIVIPIDRGDLPYDVVRKLVVHEIGVHVLRSLTGAQTDVGPLKTGLADYYETEEGLGKVMEQAIDGEFAEAGIDHYITAGAAYFDRMNFRDAYEMKWRIAALEKLEEGEDLTDEAIATAQSAAYGGVMRIYRGTDELPWFKDLAYYNGSVETWKFLETIRGDEFRLTLLMMGKVGITPGHNRTILESRTT